MAIFGTAGILAGRSGVAGALANHCSGHCRTDCFPGLGAACGCTTCSASPHTAPRHGHHHKPHVDWLDYHALSVAYDALGLDEAAGGGGDEVFQQLVLARIIEPTSKQDNLRVLEEARVAAVFYASVHRRLPGYAGSVLRELAATCAAHAALEPASL